MILLHGYRKTGIVSAETGETGSQIGFLIGAAAGIAAVALAPATFGTSLAAFAVGASIGGAVGSLVGGILDPVKPKETHNTPQSGIKDFFITSAALGQMIPILFGTYRVPGNIIYATKKQERFVFTEVPSQTPPASKLKGGGEDVQIVTTKAYSITMAIALCEGPIAGIKRIWLDLDLFYDESSDLGHLRYASEDEHTVHFNGVNNSVAEVVVYKGTETQTPDQYIANATDEKVLDPGTGEVQVVAALTPGYRGTAYAVFAGLDLGSSGRVGNLTFEVVKDRNAMAVERPMDLVLGRDGLYVLGTKDMMPQPTFVQHVGIFVILGEEPNINNNQLYLQGVHSPNGPESWMDLGITLGTIIIEGALIPGNNRTTEVLFIQGKLLLIDGTFTQDTNQIAVTQPGQPLHTADRYGTVRAYNTPVLTQAGVRNVGIFPQAIAVANANGTANDIVFVDASGTLDEVEDGSADTGWVFTAGLALNDPNAGPVPLRQEGEIPAGTKLGAGHVSSNGDRYFYICLETSWILELFDAIANVFFRAQLSSKPIESVWSPLGGGGGHVYVLREGDVVTRLSGGSDLSLVDEIAVELGSAFGHLLCARADGRIWCSNNHANSLRYFTTATDGGRVGVMPNPSALTEARDNFIWTASLDRGEVTRVDPTTYAIQIFNVPDIMTSLAPAQGGKIWAVSSETRSAIYQIDTDGSYVMLTLPHGASKVVADISGDPQKDGYAYVMCEEANTVVSVLPDCSRLQTIDAEGGLARCIESLSVRAGLPADRVDTAGLINNQVNFILSEVASAKDTISQLADAFQFNFVESEGYLRFYHNHTIPTVAEIAESTLAGGIDKEDSKSLAVSRLQERELPTKVTVSYASPERNYQDRSEVVQLTSGNIEDNPQVFRYPFSLSTDEAFQLAEIRLYEPWIQRERTEFTLPPLFIVLDPGDAVQVTAREISYNIRINEMTRARTWLNTVRGVTTYPPSFTTAAPAALMRSSRSLQAQGRAGAGSGATPLQLGIYLDTISTPGKSQPIMDPRHPGVALSVPGTGIITLQNPSRMAITLLDPPALNPTDIVLRAYLGTYSLQPGRAFSVSNLYRSADGVIDFNYVGSDSTASTAGKSLTVLASVTNPYVWDDTNTVDIQMLSGTLNMVSELDVLNGANRALLGRELIQFVKPTLVAPRTYRLSKLLRGRLGTQEFIGTHTLTDLFVLLDANTLRDTTLYDRAIVDREYFYRTVDSTTTLTAATSFPQTLHGNVLKPWAPLLKPVLRAGTDIQFTWLYRSRLNPDLVDYGGIAWDIDFTKQFQIVIYTSGFTAVQHVYTTPVFPGSAENTLVFTYTAAQQVADFGSVQAQVYYGIAGLGAQNILGYESRSYG